MAKSGFLAPPSPAGGSDSGLEIHPLPTTPLILTKRRPGLSNNYTCQHLKVPKPSQRPAKRALTLAVGLLTENGSDYRSHSTDMLEAP